MFHQRAIACMLCLDVLASMVWGVGVTVLLGITVWSLFGLLICRTTCHNTIWEKVPWRLLAVFVIEC